MKHRIVLVSFPFDDLASTKVRPAVCLTDAIGPHQHVVLAFISSRMPGDLLPSDIIIEDTHPDFSTTGLRVTSVFRLHRIMTAGVAIIRRDLGCVPASFTRQLRDKLRSLLCA